MLHTLTTLTALFLIVSLSAFIWHEIKNAIDLWEDQNQ